MNTPEPSWAPLAAPPTAMEAALHLRFAITAAGPSLQHLAGGAEAVGRPQPHSAWHELSVAALLVCLMAEETAFARTGGGADVADPRLVPPPLAEAARLLPPIPLQLGTPGPFLPAEFGMPMDDDWTMLLHGRSAMDAAWPLA